MVCLNECNVYSSMQHEYSHTSRPFAALFSIHLMIQLPPHCYPVTFKVLYGI